MNFLLEVTDYNKPIEDVSEKLLFGGNMLLRGMLTVFVVLFTLWLILVLFKVFFHDIPKRRPKKVKPVKETATVVPRESVDNADEIVAVIAAAIAAAEAESGSTAKFRVVSFKRK